MKRLPYPLKILMPGLLAAHVIAAMQVYASNRGLYGTLADLAAAGYLIVPNERVMPHLLEFGTAMAGALFFTLSIGAGLTVLSLVAAWVWDRACARKKMLLIPFALLWVILAALPNVREFSPFVSLYFLVIPPLVFLLAARTLPPRTGGRQALREAAHAIPLILIAACWGAFMNEWFFLNVRDTILLSNPVGIRANDFYYRYTLYPAEAFKTLQQKTLKTCRIAGVEDAALAASLEKALARFDYCAVGGVSRTDLTVRKQNGTLHFERNGRVLATSRPRDFLARPAEALRQFSQQSDGNIFFRRITFLSLVAGLPVALYIIVYGILRFALSFFMNAKGASIAASTACLAVGILLAAPLYTQDDAVSPEEVAAALESPDRHRRVAALRTIDRENLDIGSYPAWRNNAAGTGAGVAERYWTAFVLGKSRLPETYPAIVTLLDDPHPNVVCKAIEALGNRDDRSAVELLTERVRTSDHWYVQWYAYRALRSLGWKQTKSA